MATTQDGPAAQRGALLDRLLLLHQFIPADEVLQVLEDTGCLDARRCTLTFEVTCWIVLAMGLLTDLPIRAVFQASTSLHSLAGPAPARSSLCEARQRLGIPPLRRLFYRFARPLAGPGTPGAFCKGLRLVGIDGTVLALPDSPANARAFGRVTGPRGDAAFPQALKVSLVELGTHAELAFAVRPVAAKGGERGVVPSLLRHVQPGMLLLLDAGFYSYALWQQALAVGAEVLLRLSATLKLPVLKVLPDGSYLSKVYPTCWARKTGQGGTWVRVIRYTHDDPRRVGRGKEHRLLTTLLDHGKHPAEELICLYHERWEIELAFDEQKTHHAPILPGKEAQLRSETPAGVVQEAYALALGHWLTRAFMAQAAARAGLDPDRLSFVGCLRVLRMRLAEYPAVPPPRRAAWYEALLGEMARERTEPRRNRINPRVVKSKMSRFLKKRPEHRGLPPLTQTFAESIVML
jgi:hypothetical protein